MRPTSLLVLFKQGTSNCQNVKLFWCRIGTKHWENLYIVLLFSSSRKQRAASTLLKLSPIWVYSCHWEMNMKFEICLVVSLLFTVDVLCHFKADPRLLLVSLDGFRWDYLKKNASFPNFKRIIKDGIHARLGVKNAFLTKTFPDHYTIVTGLYEESHGIVGNTFFDPDFNQTFAVWNETQERQSKWFDDGGEPIWVTNQKYSTARRSGSVFWPGDRAPVKGFLPYRHLSYDSTVPFRKRIDWIIGWFIDEYPINLGLLYYEQPDHCGHTFGPESDQMLEQLIELDGDIGYLLQQLEKNDILDDVNVIITSDHGMTSTPTDEEHEINLDKYLDLMSYDINSVNPVATIRPKSDGMLLYKSPEWDKQIFSGLKYPSIIIYLWVLKSFVLLRQFFWVLITHSYLLGLHGCILIILLPSMF